MNTQNSIAHDPYNGKDQPYQCTLCYDTGRIKTEVVVEYNDWRGTSTFTLYDDCPLCAPIIGIDDLKNINLGTGVSL